MREKLEDRARQAFLELEEIVASHRKSNVIPTFGAADILDAAHLLVKTVIELRDRGWLEDAPSIEKVNDPSNEVE